jgi:hypothetical protein
MQETKRSSSPVEKWKKGGMREVFYGKHGPVTGKKREIGPQSPGEKGMGGQRVG